MNIFVLAAGEGRRFADAGYADPKPLIRVRGERMIVRVLRKLGVDKQHRLFVIANISMRRYRLQDILRQAGFGDGARPRVLYLAERTSGPAETLVRGIGAAEERNLLQGNEPIVSVDCDVEHETTVLRSLERCSGNVLTVFREEDRSTKPKYSYIVYAGDDSGQFRILGIREKERPYATDNLACSGIYMFAGAALVRRLYDDGAIYISDLYQRRLAEPDGRVYAIRISRTECINLGTPEQLWRMSREYALEGARPPRICWDLDNTLVTHPRVPGDYSTVEPIDANIALLRDQKRQGCHIIIHTARRMRTHGGNVGGVLADVGELTLEQLREFGIPYDEIHFGKPWADVYIDDLGVNPDNESVPSGTGIYPEIVEPRSIHTVDWDRSTFTKRGDVRDEHYWYSHLPEGLRRYTAWLPEENSEEKAAQGEIVLERVRGVPFSYLHANGMLTPEHFAELCVALSAMHETEIPEGEPVPSYSKLYHKKLLRRTEQLCAWRPEYRRVVGDLVVDLKEYYRRSMVTSIIHGDPVFTNVLWTPDQRVVLVDPRGRAGPQTILGDPMYDWAKVYQSLIGYDYALLRTWPGSKDGFLRMYLERLFAEESMLGTLKMLTRCLLLSLLPLHDRKFWDPILELERSLR